MQQTGLRARRRFAVRFFLLRRGPILYGLQPAEDTNVPQRTVKSSGPSESVCTLRFDSWNCSSDLDGWSWPIMDAVEGVLGRFQILNQAKLN